MPEKFTSTVRIKLLYLAVEHFGIGAIVKLESFRLRRHPFTSVECLHFMCAASCLNVRWQCGHTPALILFVCFLSFAVAVRLVSPRYGVVTFATQANDWLRLTSLASLRGSSPRLSCLDTIAYAH